MNTTTPPAKVAVFIPAASLGDKTFYGIGYYVDGDLTGRGMANGHELDAWFADLRASGWEIDDQTGRGSEQQDGGTSHE